MSVQDVLRYYDQSYPPDLYGPPPTPPTPPTLTTLTPSAYVVNVPVTITLTGTGFVPSSLVQTANQGNKTPTFVSDTELTLLFTPLYVGTENLWMKVRNGLVASAPVNYTVAAAAADDEPEPEEDSP